MAWPEVQGILEGLRLSQQRQAQQQALYQQQQESYAREQERQQQLELQKAQLEQQKKYQDAQMKLAQQAANLQHLANLQKIAESAQAGVPTPGATFEPAAPQTVSGIPSVENLNQANEYAKAHQIMTLPVTDEKGQPLRIPILTPEAAAARITPEEAARTRIIEATKKEDFERAEASKQADFQRMMMQKLFDDERVRKTQEAETERVKMRIKSSEKIAEMTKGVRDIDLSPYAQDVIDGNLSREDILRLPIPKPAQMKILGAVTEAGARPLSKEQIAMVGEFSQMVDAIRLIDQVIANQPQTHNIIASHLAGIPATMNQNVTAPEKELNGRVSLIARGFAKERGNLSNQDILRVQKGIIPSRFDPIETNIKKRNDYRLELDKLIDSKLSNLPQAQRNIIKKRVGLFNYGLYGQAPQAIQPQVQSPATVNPGTNINFVWTPQGLQAVQ